MHSGLADLAPRKRARVRMKLGVILPQYEIGLDSGALAPLPRQSKIWAISIWSLSIVCSRRIPGMSLWCSMLSWRVGHKSWN